jgi:hypothetical protein
MENNMDLMMDPTLFTVEQSKQMGIWPPSDVVGIGIMPYIKRMRGGDLRILDVGVDKGDNAVYMLESDSGMVPKIFMIHGVVSEDAPPEHEYILKKNTKDFDRFTTLEFKDKYDAVCVNSTLKNLDKQMEKYYSMVKSNGIFCGNNHDEIYVKESLAKFRRSNKIGTPIMVSNGCWFWYVR